MLPLRIQRPYETLYSDKGSKDMIILINGKPTVFNDHDHVSDGLGGRHGGHGNNDEDYD